MFIISFDNKGIFLKVKEKSTMEDKIFDFAKTRDALGQLSADLAGLEAAIKIKQSALSSEKQNLANQLQDKEQKIASLNKAAEDALVKLENINQYIGKVL